jgi:LEA14-like dessication related protein
MRRFFFLILLAVALFGASSCKVSVPTFKSISNVKFETLSNKSIKLGAEATFHNPNIAKVKVTDIGVDVLLNDKKIGTLGELPSVVIKPKSDFTIPVGINIQQDASLPDLLQTVLGFFSDKEMNLQIQGDVKFKVFCFKYHVPFKHGQKIKLSQLKKQ